MPINAFYVPNAKQQFCDGNGKPLAGGTVNMYIPSTTTFKNTWQDSGQAALNSNPIILDGNGEAIIYGTGNYRQQVFDSSSNLVWDAVVSSAAYGLLVATNNLSDVASASTALANLGGASAATLAALLPAGCVFPWGGSSPPTGYLECNGAAVSRSTFSTLFSNIGTTFGAGDGSTTFNIPDCRGYFVRGWDDGRGIDTGRTRGTNQASALASHTHANTLSDPGHVHHCNIGASDKGGSGNGYAYSDGAGGSTVKATYDIISDFVAATTGITITNAAFGGTDTYPINIAMMYIIKST